MKNFDIDALKKKKLFLFDIDGTLAIGDTLCRGSRSLLSHIASVGGQAFYITNNSTKSSADYAERFRKVFQLEAAEKQFVTSGYMTLRFLKENYDGKKIYVLGTASFIAELRKNGLTVTEKAGKDIACAVAAYDSELNYGKLTEACRVLSAGDVPFYATNPDLCCPVDFGFIPDCGAICGMLTHATGKTPVYLGKPNKSIVELCLAQSGFSKEETLVVGDRLYTDIACGINAGVDTCLVFTGEAGPDDLADTQYPPSCTFETIEGLLNACI